MWAWPAKGTGSLYSGLLKLNPELLRAVLTAGDQEERLKLVANAMSRTTDATQKAALAAAAFGKWRHRSCQSTGRRCCFLDKFMATARELGIIVPKDLIDRASKLNDKLNVLSKVMDINISQALVNAAPLLVKGGGRCRTVCQGYQSTF